MAARVQVPPAVQNSNNVFMKKLVTKSDIEKYCTNSLTMSKAAYKAKMHYNTFKRYAKMYNCWNPNQSGKGTHKKSNSIPIDEILQGKHPTYQTGKLRNRLIKEGIKTYQCECCGISSWNGKPINLELHHIDGNRFNHVISNLQLLCPNCHSQTDTFRSKNIKSI